MKKRLIGLLLGSVIVVTAVAGASDVYAAEVQGSQNAQNPTGLLSVEVIELPQGTTEDLYDAEELQISGEADFHASAIYNSEWDKYKNYYVYNQMNEAQQEYWDALDAVCMTYLTSTADAEYGGSERYYTAMVGSDTLSTEEVAQVLSIFRYSNPQYYFLNNYIYTITSGADVYYAFGVYSAFADGTQRSVATQEVKAQADSWQSLMNACDTEEQKVKLIHDLIVEKVEYNDSIYESGFDENVAYSQSAYSVLCGDSTVCAGYSQAFEMMCNAVGIDAIAVTSEGHEWNKVRINDSWYNVDVTWADQSYIYYEFFERNDNYYDTVDSDSASSHCEESIWDGYLPTCSLDTNPSGNYSVPGTLPTISQTVATPQITITGDSAAQTVSIACDTPGATIYYTVDGTTPSPAATKSEVYSGTFTTASTDIRAVAVRDTYWDSEVKVGATGSNNGNSDSGNNSGNPDSGNDSGNTDSGNTDNGNTDSGESGGNEGGSETVQNGLVERNGKYYYYENGVMATSKEAYVNGAWRWFDADGSMAVSKDVYLSSNGGKWVRYNENGEMIKGEDYRYGAWYYFEPITGVMMKGPVVLEDGRKVFYDTVTGQMLKGTYQIGGQTYVFDEVDGHLISGTDTLFWVDIDGKHYWYENWQRQGWDPANEAYRGKEIYDPTSNGWYWLDNVQQGAMATSKDVYQESSGGKWVRYKADGSMVKGWDTNENGTYYFDLITGAMVKGWNEIDGRSYYFDETTGVLR